MPEREAAAYMREAGFYNNPEALQQAVFTIRKHGPSGLFERSADEAAAAGVYTPKYGKSPLETWQQERAVTEAANAKFRDMFGFDLGQAAGRGSAGEAAAGSRSFRFDMSPEEAARARASHEAFVRDAAAGRGSAGNGAAADGGVSELANAGNVGRGVAAGERAAAERAGINAEIARANMEASDVFNAQLIQRIKAGTTTPDDRIVIWALMQARITPYTPASDRAVVDAARAAGIIE